MKKIMKKILRIMTPIILKSNYVSKIVSKNFSNALEYQLLDYKEVFPTKIGNRSSPKNVIFAPIFGLAEAPIAVQAALAIELRKLGVSCEFMACDQYLKACMWDSEEYISGDCHIVDKIKRKVKCFECTASINAATNVLGSKFISLSKTSKLYNHRTGEEVDPIFGATSAVRKTLTSTVNDFPNTKIIAEKFHRIAQDYLDVLVSYLRDKRPTAMVMVHGIYLEHGPIVQACKILNIPVYVFAFMYRNNTVSLVKGETYHKKVYELPDSCFEEIDLTPKRLERLESYLGSKLSGGRDYVNYHPCPQFDKAVIQKELGLDLNQPILLFCTNVLWDATIYYKSEIYDDILEATFDTIEKCIELKRQLIIRVHPAEAKGGFSTKMPFKEQIDKRFSILPTNIKIVDASSDISTYVLAEMSDIVLNFASNVGLELAVSGKRVVNLGNAYSCKRGFSIEPASRKEFLKILENPTNFSTMSSEEVIRAKKFAYFWFFQFMTEVPQLELNHLETRESKINLTDFRIPAKRKSKKDNIRKMAEMISENKDINYQDFI